MLSSILLVYECECRLYNCNSWSAKYYSTILGEVATTESSHAADVPPCSDNDMSLVPDDQTFV